MVEGAGRLTDNKKAGSVQAGERGTTMKAVATCWVTFLVLGCLWGCWLGVLLFSSFPSLRRGNAYCTAPAARSNNLTTYHITLHVAPS